MPELTAAEAQKIFNQTSKALHDNDPVKLAEVMESQPDEEQVTNEPEVPAEEPETPDDSSKEVPAKEESEAAPPEKAEEPAKEEPAKEEQGELDKLREHVANLERANHALRSQAGRVPHVQRKLKEYDKKLDELSQKLTSPSSQPSTELQKTLQQVLKGVEGADAELAKAIADAVLAATESQAKDSITKERDQLKFLRDQEVQTHQLDEANRLLELYPNAPEVFASEGWKKWKTEQPPGIRRLAEGESAEDVSFAFEKYAKDMIALYPALAKVEDKVVATASPVTDDAAERAKQVETERQRKKATAVTVANPTASGKVDLPDDPQALFNKFAEQIRKERTG